jgi:hypothetical protein
MSFFIDSGILSWPSNIFSKMGSISLEVRSYFFG